VGVTQTTITLSHAEKEKLAENKPETTPWGTWLLSLDETARDTVSDAANPDVSDNLVDRLDRIESAAKEATSAAQSTQRAIEDMEKRR